MANNGEHTLSNESPNNSDAMYCHSGIQVSVNELGFAVILPQMMLVETFPNYDNFVVEVVDPPMGIDTVTCDQVGMTIEVMVTDTSTGNSCWSYIGVEDKLDPIITCDTFFLPCSQDPYNLPDYVRPTSMSDNCTDSVDLIVSSTNSIPMLLDCSTGYVARVEVYWTVADESGNDVECTQIVLLEAPEMTDVMIPADYVAQCPVDPADLDPSVTGVPTIDGLPLNGTACMLVTTNEDQPIFEQCGNTYTFKRRWIVTNWCNGATQSFFQQISVVDTIPPVVTCIPDVTIEATADCMANFTIPNPAVYDACTDIDDFSYRFIVDGTAIVGSTAQNLNLGNHVIQSIARDACGLEDTCSFNVYVQDNLAPEVECNHHDVALGPDGMVTIAYNYFTGHYYNDGCGIVDTLIRRVNSNCGDPQDQVFGETIKFCCDDIGSPVMVAIQVTDIHGNSNVCMFSITVEDNEAPVINCPGNLAIPCNSDTSTASTGLATATDNCDVNVTYSDNIIPGDCGQAYTIERTFVAYDGTNTSTCTQIINVIDNVNPIITCPANITLGCAADTSPVNTGVATATDMCSTPAISYADISMTGSCANTLTITRRWTAVDDCGNEATCDQIITVEDDTPPTLTIPANMTLNCPTDTSTSSTGVATATDDCNDAVVTYEDVVTPGSCPNTFSVERIWTATDVCMNTISQSQIINVIDNTAPTISCPASMTLNCPADTALNVTGTATASDECNTAVSISYVDDVTPGACDMTFTVVRTFTAEDACGNTAQCSQTITVVDNTAPNITCPGSLTLNCPADTSVNTTGMAVATDECNDDPVISYEDDVTPGSCANTFTVARTWTATDACGNTATCVQTINVIDNVDPILDLPANVTLNCPADTSVSSTGVATATDECNNPPSISYIDVVTAGSCPNTFTIERTWTATDACGNTSEGAQIIDVIDNISPQITCPASIALECPADTSTDVTGVATATDACQTQIAISYSDVVTPGDCANTFEIIRTWTATDACGNAASCEQVINVQDDTDPMLTCPPSVVVNCPGDTSVAETGMATATDACSPNVTISYLDDVTPGDCPNTFNVSRTWTATDDCGNSVSCVQIIDVVDVTAPTISCPANLTLQCTADTSIAATGLATATDECGDASISVSTQVTQGSCAQEFTIVRTFTASDECGNSSTCSQTITVSDDVAPIIDCPDGITLECPADTVVDNTNGPATATDACDDDVEISYTSSVTPGSCPGAFTLVRTWSATDDCGNTSTCEQTIVVDDTTPPVISCPADVTLDCPADTTAATNGTATATDACDNNPTISYSDIVTAGSCNGIFMVEREWTATDACGNSMTCTQTLTIEDNTAPAIVCPADMTLDCPADTTVANTQMATATDACNTPIITYSDVVTQGSCPNTFSVVRTWVATDPCGNSSSCDQLIDVVDVTAPTITCPADTILPCGADTTPAATGMPVVSDECNGGTVMLSYSDDVNAGTGNVVFEITRTWTATDLCGNDISCVQVITVTDNASPIIVCPDPITVAAGTDSCEAFVSVPEPTVSDACGGITVVNDGNGDDQLDASGVYPVGTTQVMYIVTDDFGNSDTCTLEITVTDEQAPEIDCPADMTVSCDADLFPLSQYGDATATDNCPDVTITVDSVVSINSCEDGVITRTFTATDAAGNAVSCTQTITIEGVTPLDSLDINWPSSQVQSFDCLEIDEIALPFPTTDAPCALIGVDTSISQVIPATLGCTTYVVSYTVTDSCAFDPNTGEGQWTFDQTVGIFDTIAPVLDTTFAVPTSFFADGDCMADVTLPAITATDNCSNLSITNNSPFANGDGADASGTYPGGSTVFSYFATDICGNTDTFEFEVFVMDTITPTIVCLKTELALGPDSIHVVNVHDDTEAFEFVGDNCTEVNDMILTFTLDDPSDSIRVYDCSHVGTIVEVWIYAIDEQGNVDSCLSEYGIDDPLGLCQTSLTINVGGQVFMTDGTPISDVEIEKMQSGDMEMDMSDDEGDFMFEDVSKLSTSRLDASKDDHYLNGLSAYDLSLMARHIAGIEYLNDPYLYYAADVNGDKQLDIRDILEMRKLLIGITSEFSVPTWAFYDASIDVNNTVNPFDTDLAEYIMIYGGSQTDMTHADFLGVKMGDLDLSAEMGLTVSEERSRQVATLRVGQPLDMHGEDLHPVYIEGDDVIIGGQAMLSIHSDEFEIIPNELMQFEQQEINTMLLERNVLRFAWISEKNHAVSAEPLFWIKSNGAGPVHLELLDFNHEFFDATGQKYDVEIKVDEFGVVADDEGFVLYQNVPNPFTFGTTIGFNLPSSGTYEFTVYDAKGAMLWTQKSNGEQGFNSIEIGQEALKGQTGVLFYQLSTDGYQAIRKMTVTQ